MSALSVAVESGIQNFAYNLRLMPTMIELQHRSKKALKDPDFIKEFQEKSAQKEQKAQTKASKAEEKAQEKKDKETMKQSEKHAKENNYGEFTQNVKNDIVIMSDGDQIKKAKLISKALETQKLIQYAYFYMTDERAELVKKNQTEREIINAVAAIFDFGKIYDSVGEANLKLYDSSCKEDFLENSKYLLSIKDIEAKKSDTAWIERMQKRKEQLLAESQFPQDDEPEENSSHFWKTDDEGIIHPIFINEDGISLTDELPVQGNGISNELFKKLEDALTPFVGKHRYELTGDMITLYVYRENANVEESYLVDPGIVMGGGEISVFAKVSLDNGATDTIFVSAKHKEILQNVLNSSFYIMTKNEAQEVLLDYFRNMEIYRYVDMSGTEFLKNLSVDDFQKLGKKLTFILSKVRDQSNNGMPRFRFNLWNSVDDFMIISDPKVKSPLAYLNETSPIICEGLIYEVHGDDVIQTFKTTRYEFHIDKYNEL